MPIMSLKAAIFGLVIVVFHSAGFAEVGNEGPHGGDWIAAEFTAKGHDVIKMLEKGGNLSLIEKSTLTQLKGSINNTPVHSVSNILYDASGVEKDALTVDDAFSPTGKSIHLNQIRWEKILTTSASAHRLVFHEYLWSIGVDDTNYLISSRLQIIPENPSAKRDALSGTQWLLEMSNLKSSVGLLDLRSKITISFNEDGTYAFQQILGSRNSFERARGRFTTGKYTLENNNVNFSAETSSCPLNSEIIKDLSQISITMKFDGKNLILSPRSQATAYIFTQINTPITFPFEIQLGCVSPDFTFTPFVDGIRSGNPVPAIPFLNRPSNQNDHFQAVAYSPRADVVGVSWNWATIEKASLQAAINCGKADCYIVNWAVNQCLVIARRGRSGAFVWADPSLQMAERLALDACAKSSSIGECVITDKICPEGQIFIK